MSKDAVRRALAGRPELRQVQDSLRAPPPRSKLVAKSPYWEPVVREGVAVPGWVFHVKADKSDPHGHDFFYEVAYEHEGQVKVFACEKGIDPWDWKFTGPWGSWFHETVLECRAATVVLHPQYEPVLFGDTEPFELVSLAEQVALAHAATAERRAKATEVAIEILQEASAADRRRVAGLLSPYASKYTSRAHDEFYVVADLYGYARQGGDVLAILEAIATNLSEARKEFWAAE